MDLNTMMNNIDNFAKAEISASQEFYKNRPEAPAEPTDIYQRDAAKRRDNAKKKYPRGASAIVAMAVRSVVEGDGAEGLGKAYRRAKNDAEALKQTGELDRAEIVRQQYMTEHFLPALEIVVNSASPDEALNAKGALSELDKFVLMPGFGSGSGYSAAYIRQAYADQMGGVSRRSDPDVKAQVTRIRSMINDGQVRMACGMAAKLKEKIDKGEQIADDIDYDLIGRIAAYGK